MGKGFEAVHLSGIPKLSPESFKGLPLNSASLLREGTPLLPDENLLREVVKRLKDPVA